MLDTNQVVGFVPASDLDRARKFYEGTLGLRIYHGDPFGLYVAAGGVPVRIAWVENLRPQPYTILGWNVRSITREIDTLVKRGIKFARFPVLPQDARGIWVSPSGAKVAWFRDSEGNLLSLTEAVPPARKLRARKGTLPVKAKSAPRTGKRPSGKARAKPKSLARKRR
jgi:catechol 2,3-dioxygenase-like lactoylglutathione lyase family enzyme